MNGLPADKIVCYGPPVFVGFAAIRGWLGSWYVGRLKGFFVLPNNTVGLLLLCV